MALVKAKSHNGVIVCTLNFETCPSTQPPLRPSDDDDDDESTTRRRRRQPLDHSARRHNAHHRLSLGLRRLLKRLWPNTSPVLHPLRLAF
jgi:hypothetical protein